MLYSLYTLVDITETGQRHGVDTLKRSQQQNFDILLQTLGLCGNVYYTRSPERVPADVFGMFSNTAWYFEWEMEIADVFAIGDNPIAKLKEIFQYVPVITGLTESVELSPPMFVVGKNIVFHFK
jgi:hypothetical protein